MPESKYKFGIRIDKIDMDMWSVCFGLSHFFSETYLFINFIKWSISIGWLMQEEKNELTM